MTTRSGFTLIELIVALGLLGVVVVAGTLAVLQTIQGSNRARVINDARQEAEKIMVDIGREIRKAACVQYVHTVGSSFVTLATRPTNDCSGSYGTLYKFNTGGNIDKTILDPVTPIAYTNQIQPFMEVCGDPTCPSVCSATGLNVFAVNNSVTTITDPLSGSFNTTGPVNVSLTLKSTAGSGRADYCGSVTLTETFTPRN